MSDTCLSERHLRPSGTRSRDVIRFHGFRFAPPVATTLRPDGAKAASAVPDTLTREQRSKCMAAIRGKDTTPERIVRSTVHRLGFRFRLHGSEIPGKPDLVFRSRRIVIFVHGCYWHMHNCKRGRSTPVTNAAFWKTKRTTNRRRDRLTLARLRRSGWRVLVVWECQTPDRAKLATRLTEFLGSRSFGATRSSPRPCRGRPRPSRTPARPSSRVAAARNPRSSAAR